MHVHSAPDPHHQSADFLQELPDELPGAHDSAPSGAQPAQDHSSDVHCFTLILSEDALPDTVSQVALYARYQSPLCAHALSPPVPPPDLALKR